MQDSPELYRVIGYIPNKDLLPLNLKQSGIGSIVRQDKPSERVLVRGMRTGECRKPRAGEWFLSGAIPEVHHAQNDLNFSYPICKLVKAKRITIEIPMED